MWLLLNNGKTFLLKDHFERRLRFLSTFTNTNCTISSPDSAGSFGDISPLVPVPPAGLVPPCRPACRVVPVGPACPLSLAVLGRPRVLYFLSLLVGLSVISSRMTRLRQTGFTEVTQEHGERNLFFSQTAVRSGTIYLYEVIFICTLKGQREGWDDTQEEKELLLFVV